jgi:hypothetical protein
MKRLKTTEAHRWFKHRYSMQQLGMKEQLTLEACCVHHAWYQVWHILPGVILVEVEDVHHCKQQGTGSQLIQIAAGSETDPGCLELR